MSRGGLNDLHDKYPCIVYTLAYGIIQDKT